MLDPEEMYSGRVFAWQGVSRIACSEARNTRKRMPAPVSGNPIN
jgi:hypothetical protein